MVALVPGFSEGGGETRERESAPSLLPLERPHIGRCVQFVASMRGTKWGLGLQAEKFRAVILSVRYQKSSEITPFYGKFKSAKTVSASIQKRRNKRFFFIVTNGETVRKMLQRRLCENPRQFTEP